MKVIVTQSLIKRMFQHGVPVEYCPKSVYEHTLNNSIDFVSESMDKGNYFETLCLGGGFEGKQVTDLKRKVNGEKTLDQTRIDTQHLRFEQLKKKYNLHIIPGFNTQRTIYKKFPEPFDGHEIILRMDTDVFPTLMDTNSRKGLMSTIDLKLTKDIKTGWGMFNWSDAGSMDHIQAYMYHEGMIDIDPELNPELVEAIQEMGLSMETYEALEKHFFYWVFDYSPQQNVKIIEVKYDTLKQKELYESIRATASEVIFNTNSERWNDTKPSKENCGYCALDCPFRYSKESAAVSEENNEFENCEYEVL